MVYFLLLLDLLKSLVDGSFHIIYDFRSQG